jgi:hypothetical protein
VNIIKKLIKMETGLFDKNGVQVQIGDKYTVEGGFRKNRTIFTVFWKSGAMCGGTSYDKCVPLAWEVADVEYSEDAFDGLISDPILDWMEIITTNEV